MEMTDQSAGIVPYDVPRVTSILAGLPQMSGRRIATDDIHNYLSFGSLVVERYDSEATVTRQLSPWDLYPESQAVQRATRDIRISGEPVISAFATGAWRLLIASKTIELPSNLGGASFASVRRETLIGLTARLYAPQAQSKDTNSHAISVWRAMVLQADDVATSSFLFTALRLASRTMSACSKASR